MSGRKTSDPHAPSAPASQARARAAASLRTTAARAPGLRDRLREVIERDRALSDANRALANGFTDQESGTRMRLPHAPEQRALEPDEIASIDALLNGDFSPAPPVGEASNVTDGAHFIEPAPAGPPPAAQPSAAWQAARAWRGAKATRPAPAVAAPEPESDGRVTLPGPSAWDSAPLTWPEPALGGRGALAEWEQPPSDDDGALDLDAPYAASAAQPGLSPEVVSVFADWIAEEVGGLDDPGPAPVVLTPELAPTLHTTTVSPAPREDVDEPRSGSEPIRTRTMARLLAGHGYKARALSIYDELLARRPDDADLRAEADALRRSGK